MRFTSYFYNGNEISVHNSILGVESVRYNGQKMTSKFSIEGAIHEFIVHEEGQEAIYRVDIKMTMLGTAISIWRNGEVLLLGRGTSTRKAHIVSRHSELV